MRPPPKLGMFVVDVASTSSQRPAASAIGAKREASKRPVLRPLRLAAFCSNADVPSRRQAQQHASAHLSGRRRIVPATRLADFFVPSAPSRPAQPKAPPAALVKVKVEAPLLQAKLRPAIKLVVAPTGQESAGVTSPVRRLRLTFSRSGLCLSPPTVKEEGSPLSSTDDWRPPPRPPRTSLVGGFYACRLFGAQQGCHAESRAEEALCSLPWEPCLSAAMCKKEGWLGIAEKGGPTPACERAPEAAVIFPPSNCSACGQTAVSSV